MTMADDVLWYTLAVSRAGKMGLAVEVQGRNFVIFDARGGGMFASYPTVLELVAWIDGYSTGQQRGELPRGQ